MKRISRREFVRVGSLVTAATVAAACAKPEAADVPASPTAVPPTAAPAPTSPISSDTTPPTPMPTAEPTATYKEAPMLADLVAAGELPAVDDRLPNNPCVCPVNASTGNYGGVLRRAFKGVSDGNGPGKLTGESLIWFNNDLSLRANLAESWETNEDSSVWTIRLREGTRWSDGTPLTSADARWYWDNVLKNETITPVVLAAYTWGPDRELAELETPDDFTIVLKYGEPKPMLVYELTFRQPFVPGFYLEQFHPDFVGEEAVMAAASEAGFATWDLYYADRQNYLMNIDVPVLYVWKMDNSLQNELFIMSRNPYFWQVDADGQQLPYIDYVNHRLFETPDVFNMWIVNGEIDYQARHIDIGNYTLYKESEAAGEFAVETLTSALHPILIPNMTCKNLKLREFFMERDARIAMSYAMDRESINELAFDGLGKPRQFSPVEGSPNYYPALSEAYLEYDPDKANEMLDALGYTEKNAEGYRLYKDGSEAVSFTIEMFYQPGDPNEDAAQLMIKYLADVGIKCQYKYAERSLFYEHVRANDVEADNWQMDRSVVPLADPGNFTGEGPMLYRPWAGAWCLYRDNPSSPNAEEPPEGHWIWDIWALADAIQVEPDPAKRDELFTEVLDIWIRELPAIGILGMLPQIVIVKDGLMNFIPGLPYDNTTMDEHLQNTQTFYWDDPMAHGA